MNITSAAVDLAHELQVMLFELARREDDLACAEAAATPYWEPTPTSVVGHRSAAAALRAQAEAIFTVQAA